jgi:signal transduction histidine kinase
MLDGLFRQRAAVVPDPHIVLIGIERSDIERYDEDKRRPELNLANCVCDTICRTDLAGLITKARSGGARTVALDLSIKDPCPVKGHDDALRTALSGKPCEAIIVIDANPTPGTMWYTPPAASVIGDPQPILASPVMYNPSGKIRSVPLVQTGRLPQREEDRLRAFESPTSVFPALGAAAYASMVGHSCEVPDAIEDDLVTCVGARFPVWRSETVCLLSPLPRARSGGSAHAMLINWVGPPGTFPMYAASAVLHEEDQGRLNAWFTGKAVLIGSAMERKLVPVNGRPRRAERPFVDQSADAAMSGLEIHANVLDTMLRGRFVQPVSHPLTWLIMLVTMFLTIVVFRSAGTPGALTFLAVEVGALLVAARVLVARDLWLVTAIPILSLVSAGAVCAVWGYTKATHQAFELRRQLRAIDGATATTVHDLKQPLAAINALAATLRQLQEKGRLSDAPEIIKRIENQVGSALGGINDLLLADPDRPVRLNRQRFDVAALARDLGLALGLTSSAHELAVYPPEGEVVIDGDPQLIGRVLNNLIENAIKYSPAGGRVTVEVAPFPQVTVIRVTDQGMGIPPDRLDAIFERYERAVPEGSTIPGTGVGLYSVERLVEAHGGRITAKSELGTGSVFTVTLPSRVPEDAHPVAR